MSEEVKTLRVKIDKAVISTLPRFSFQGKIVVVQSEREIAQALPVIRSAGIVGIDTETRPTFRKGETNRVALLQISTETICFLFRLSMTGLTPALVELLADPGLKKVGLSLKDDLMVLRRRCEFLPAGFIDLQPLVKEMGIEDQSLQKLYANFFGMRISKSAQRSNWEVDVYSESQRLYAATDAYTCLQLYKEISRLKQTGAYRITEAL